ncbi:NAD(P)/FAD-dependent oxidoreductase [Xanthovirga aplysinae]|uniref:NAD(P)/FAD-dependent oxidoreductase n=1 Tax=Xanthovirga aplysinae TaxID=2529853 RepID=UPI0012BC9582|nr:FAD-dependent oxidoreductase [Xanthovirga aplysinae]MTI32054.1 NAD(P)/FAD-dependent oxidoreductase [Xanthovirga aplysinae]
MSRIVIIGNGISGITAARNIRKTSEHEITVISAESEHFFSRTALMYIYMGHMKYEHTKPYEDWFWEKNRINLVLDYVNQVDTKNKRLALNSGKSLDYDILIIACGSTFNKFGWPGQDLNGVTGMYSLQDLEKIEKYSADTGHAVIIGGGLIGIELAEMLRSRAIEVTFLIRETHFWDNILPQKEAQMIDRHLQEHHVGLLNETLLKEILADENGRVKAVITDKGQEIPCQLVGLTAGVKPNIEFLKGSGISTDRGVLVNEYFQTNVADVYAIGDCAQFTSPPAGRKPVEQVWYTGRMHGENVAHTICKNPIAYRPGPWFNSAKFMDIEYQVYGEVSNLPKENEEHFYWEHEDGKKSVRLVFNKNNDEIMGFNLMGIRYRHEVCERWIKEKRKIGFVMENLSEANFDPEFFDRYEKTIAETFNKNYPEKAVPIKKKGFFAQFFN